MLPSVINVGIVIVTFGVVETPTGKGFVFVLVLCLVAVLASELVSILLLVGALKL